MGGRENLLNTEEKNGLALFEGRGNCAACHPGPLFTDFTYDNLGIPKNPLNPFYYQDAEYNDKGIDWVDLGLGGFFDEYPAEKGKFKVPTLRNVDKKWPGRKSEGPLVVKAYGHNGYFKSLKEIVHFYNTRDVGDVWPPPEYDGNNINTKELGDLELSGEEEDAIVAFMKTLSDGYSRNRCAAMNGIGVDLDDNLGDDLGNDLDDDLGD